MTARTKEEALSELRKALQAATDAYLDVVEVAGLAGDRPSNDSERSQERPAKLRKQMQLAPSVMRAALSVDRDDVAAVDRTSLLVWLAVALCREEIDPAPSAKAYEGFARLLGKLDPTRDLNEAIADVNAQLVALEAKRQPT